MSISIIKKQIIRHLKPFSLKDRKKPKGRRATLLAVLGRKGPERLGNVP